MDRVTVKAAIWPVRIAPWPSGRVVIACARCDKPLGASSSGSDFFELSARDVARLASIHIRNDHPEEVT